MTPDNDKLADEIDDRIDVLKTQVVEKVQEHGWFAMHVFQSEPGEYSFTYTIGFWPDHPELLIVNLPHRVAHGVLGTVYDRVKAGEKFSPGRIYAGVLRSYDIAVQDLPVEAQGEHLRWAAWYHEEHASTWPFASVQLCWPDPHGRFPWEPGYAADACPQPVFGLQS